MGDHPGIVGVVDAPEVQTVPNRDFVACRARRLIRSGRGRRRPRSVGPVRVLAPLQSNELGCPVRLPRMRGLVTVSICCALCTSLLNVEALTSSSFELPIRFCTLS